MINLIKLEFEKNYIRTYILSAIAITGVMIGFLYLLAYIPTLAPNDPDIKIFEGYKNLIPLFCAVNMAGFSLLSAVMFSKFIITPYSGKNVILQFLYPISRKRVFFSKLLAVSSFSGSFFLISIILSFSVFVTSERFIPIMTDTFSIESLKIVCFFTLVMFILVFSIGVISLLLGFIKKSIPTAIITAILLLSLISNIVLSGNIGIIMVLSVVSLIIGICGSLFLANVLEKMEAN